MPSITVKNRSQIFIAKHDNTFCHVYCATRMHSADYAVARCTSVRLSVCSSHAGIVLKRLFNHILKLFSPSGNPTILAFSKPNRMAIMRQEPPNGGVECKRV